MTTELHVLERLVYTLNTILDVDPKTARDLVETRIPCNGHLEKHPRIHVTYDEKRGNIAVIGLLGVLNSWSQPLGWRIESCWDGEKHDRLMEFRLMQVEGGPRGS